MDAARTLFAGEGYEAVSMRRIADAIEYSPTAIYVHFADKAALLREICREDFAALAGVFAALAAVKDPVERIRRIGYAYVDFAVKYPNHYQLMFMTKHPPQELEAEDLARKGRPEEDAYAFLRAAATEAIEQGRVNRGVPRDADLLAQTLWAGPYGVAGIELIHCSGPWIALRPLRDRTRLMVDIGIDGLFTAARSSKKTPAAEKPRTARKAGPR